MEIGKANCGVCRRRPREQMGSGTCPHAGTATYKQLAVLDAHECAAFKVGDNKTEVKKLGQENLAANLELF